MARCIRNKGDWFLAALVLGTRKDSDGKPKTWENLHLIRAESLAAAYEKVMNEGEAFCGALNDHTPKPWTVLGVSELVPIHEDIEDGAELLWTDLSGLPLASVRKRILTKKEWLKIRAGSKGCKAGAAAIKRKSP